MPISVRQPDLQTTAKLPTTALEQKKLQDQTRISTKKVAIGVITVLALATAAYLGTSTFGKSQPIKQPNHAARFCDMQFLLSETQKGNTPAGAGDGKFFKAYFAYLKSEDFKQCLSANKGNEIFTPFCDFWSNTAHPPHYICV